MPLPPSLKRRLDDAIKRYDLRSYHGGIEDLARLAFLLRVKPAKNEDEIPIGHSKLGGCPDLPIDFVWPESEWGGMEFMAQINLSQLPDVDHPLPTEGIFWLFSETNSAWGNPHALTYMKTPPELVRRPIPAPEFMNEDDDWCIDPEHPLQVLEFVPCVSLIVNDASDALFSEDEEANERYHNMAANLLDLQEERSQTPPKLLGYPSNLFEGSDFDPEDEELLTIESFFEDRVCYACFWDAGNLSVSVPRSGLTSMDFETSEVGIFSF